MTVHQLHLIAFGAGSAIHGIQSVLVARRWRHTTGLEHCEARECLSVSAIAFFWQFGNFFREIAQNFGFQEGSIPFEAGTFIRSAALILFPLLFTYLIGNAGIFSRINRLMRYALWPWSILVIGNQLAFQAGWIHPAIDPDLPLMITLHLMLFFFMIFAVRSWLNHRRTRTTLPPAELRANRAAILASVVAAVMFVLMLGGFDFWRFDYLPYIELAAMMTSVPFTIAVAYRLYHFPFMDMFVRETLSGLILMAGFVVALAVGEPSLESDVLVLWTVICALALAYVKEPLSRWVERTFMGYRESAEEQEERIGNAIRALTQLDEFGARVSEILKSEFEAEWVELESMPNREAAYRFEIAGPPPSWLSVGPRIGGRHYMSRHLRLARTAALQLAAHRQQLTHHELREITARAQMRALQAQINPHFLFNTLNVLANLIHTNPEKAERVTEELAEVFRYALESTRVEWVKLEDELRFLESYLEIEKARFEERLVFRFDVDPTVRSLRIPPMVLQPLVENAVKHGISPKVEGGEVRLAARIDADRLVLCVEDTGLGPRHRGRQGGAGIGLSNVRERLKHVYGDEGVLRIEERSPAGTKVSLVLPQLAGVHS